MCSGKRINGVGEQEEDTVLGCSAACWLDEDGPTHRLTVNDTGEITGVHIEVGHAGEGVLFGSTTQ